MKKSEIIERLHEMVTANSRILMPHEIDTILAAIAKLEAMP